jgi:hypothetical protein
LWVSFGSPLDQYINLLKYILVRRGMNVNKDKRLSNFILRNKLE